MARSDSRAPAKSYAEQVAEKLIEQLEQGTAPWQKPWKPGELRAPYNPTTGNAYRGFNSLWLRAQGYEDPRWMTYKQATANGAQVRKGERGTLLQFISFEGREPVLNPDGTPQLDGEGKARTQLVRYDQPRRFAFVVFNGNQIDGLPPHGPAPKMPEWERHAAAESILEASEVPLRHIRGNRAYYEVVADRITMPERDQFPTQDAYYATALHELGHATGHPTRLGRDLGNPFGSIAYAKEELRAEIASLMIGERLELGHDPGQHAAYVASWIKVLKEDPKEIMRAAADAEKITAYVMDLEQKREREQPLASLQAISLATALPDAPEAVASLAEAGLHTIADVYGPGKDTARAHVETALAKAGQGQLTSRVLAVAEEHLERVHERGLSQARTVALDTEPTQAPPASRPAPRSETSMDASRTYLHVPYAEKDQAKGLGARWDKTARSWYADTTDPEALKPFASWLQPPRPKQTPQEEFAMALREAGFQLDALPIMDGNKHRVAVEGDTGKETGGMYMGWTDGTPAGRIVNYRTGYKANWKSESSPAAALTDSDRAKLQEEAAARKAERDTAQEERYARTAAALGEFLSICAPATADHPYNAKKKIDGNGALVAPSDPALTPEGSLVRIAMTTKQASALREQNPEATVIVGGSLIIPAHGPDGRLQTIQTIAANGWKGNANGGKLTGATATLAATTPNAPVVVCEGWSTGKTLHAAGQGAVEVRVAFSSNNLAAVAAAVRSESPDRPLIIASDNDHAKANEINPRTGKPFGNPGLEKAQEAGKANAAQVMTPGFAHGSSGTDWNDYASEHGVGAVREALNEARLLADRRLLADAKLFGHDGERVEEQIRQSQASIEAPTTTMEQQPVAKIDARAAYVGLREGANREAERQDTSDEPPEQEQEQTQEAEHTKIRTRGKARSRSR